MSHKLASTRVQQLGTTIFTAMTQLANQYQAVNLGQGFPDFPAPAFLKEMGVAAINADINQYAPGIGRLSLRQAIAAKMSAHYNISVNPDSEIVVTHGATEAIFATIMALINPGDEAILFEPYYDSYLPSISFAGGTPRYYTLKSPDWAIDYEQLASLFNDKTKLILINTPHNPTGKLFSDQELSWIADLCQKHNVIAVTDEVYEHIIFDNQQHRPLASYPGMKDRTITISSLGKTFTATGWKIGWTIASPDLSTAVFRAHQFITFSGAAPLQEAAAHTLQWAQTNDYYPQLIALYQQKRDFLTSVLTDVGLNPIPSKGSYFVMADISHLPFADDIAFCRYLTSEIGVAAIPPSAFYHNPKDGAHLVRFAFCKQDKTLQEAAKRLQKLPDSLP